MKKGIFVILLCMFVLVACSQNKNELYDVSYEPQTSETVKIITEKESYTENDTLIRYSIMNVGNVQVGIAADSDCFELQKMVDGKWKRVETKIEHYWTALGQILEPNDIDERELHLDEYFYLPLETGEYRIVVENFASNSFVIS